MVYSKSSTVLNNQSGTSLTGLLIALAIGSILMVMLVQTVESFLSTSSTEKAISQVNRKSQRLLSTLRYVIHDAGFGMPDVSSCPGNTYVGNINESLGVEYPVASQPETSTQYGGTLIGPMDTLTTIHGQSITGTSVMARIINLPSTNSSVVKASVEGGIQPGDGFMVDVPGKACMVLTDTGTSGNSSNFTNWEFSHSNPTNPPNGAASLLDYMTTNNIGDGGMSANDFISARLMLMGVTTTEDMYVQGSTLMGNFITTGSQNPTVISAPIMHGVLAFRVQLGVGTNGYVSQWLTSTQWQNEAVNSRQPILAVRIGYILISSLESQQIDEPSSIHLMGATYSIPSQDVNRIVKAYVTTIPVENNVWTE